LLTNKQTKKGSQSRTSPTPMEPINKQARVVHAF